VRVEVRRKTETAKSIIGELWIDLQYECVTLEPSRTNPVHAGHPCIPAGEYPLVMTLSPHFKMITPEVMDVPGRSNIRIHPGNFPKDSLGCTLVGEEKGFDQIFQSKVAFDKLMVLFRHTLEPIVIAYLDPKPSQPTSNPITVVP
jgi:hypothetical protein